MGLPADIEFGLTHEHTEFVLPPEHTEFGLPPEHTEFGLSTEDTEFGLSPEHTEFGLSPGHTEFELEVEHTEFSMEAEHTEFHAACDTNGQNHTRLANGFCRPALRDAHPIRMTTAQPLRVIHVGQFLFRAGIESWLKSLLRFVDKRHLQFQRCVVTSNVNDVRVMREFEVPIRWEVAECAPGRDTASCS